MTVEELDQFYMDQLVNFCATCTEDELFAYCRLMVKQQELESARKELEILNVQMKQFVK